eukprot:Gb_11353 [translate_table: standard]
MKEPFFLPALPLSPAERAGIVFRMRRQVASVGILFSLVPATDSASASGRSGGARLVSAGRGIRNITDTGNKGIPNHICFCAMTISLELRGPTHIGTVYRGPPPGQDHTCKFPCMWLVRAFQAPTKFAASGYFLSGRVGVGAGSGIGWALSSTSASSRRHRIGSWSELPICRVAPLIELGESEKAAGVPFDACGRRRSYNSQVVAPPASYSATSTSARPSRFALSYSAVVPRRSTHRTVPAEPPTKEIGSAEFPNHGTNWFHTDEGGTTSGATTPTVWKIFREEVSAPVYPIYTGMDFRPALPHWPSPLFNDAPTAPQDLPSLQVRSFKVGGILLAGPGILPYNGGNRMEKATTLSPFHDPRRLIQERSAPASNPYLTDKTACEHCQQVGNGRCGFLPLEEPAQSSIKWIMFFHEALAGAGCTERISIRSRVVDEPFSFLWLMADPIQSKLSGARVIPLPQTKEGPSHFY